MNQTFPEVFVTDHDGVRLVLRFTVLQQTAAAMHRLAEIVANHRGTFPVHIRVIEVGACTDTGHRVVISPRLVEQVKSAFGPDSVEGYGPSDGAT